MNEYHFKELNWNDIKKLNSIKPDNWTSITEIHEHYLNTPNCYCIKAIQNNEILGIGTGIVFDETSWIAHIIVAQQYRNKGIGTAIVENRIEYVKNNCGCKTVSLTATDQGYPVYKKIGFIDESIYRIMKRTDIKQTSIQTTGKIIKIKEKHHEAVLKIDKMVSGENRDDFLTPILNKGYVYEKEKCILGFYLPGFGDSGVYAINDEAGIALLNERIKEEKVIFLPEENESAFKFLIDNGFSEVHRIYRMILGESFSRNPQFCYSRIGGFAG